MTSTSAKLTDYEVEALSGTFNFADGHARFTPATDHADLLKELPQLLSSKLPQDEAEAAFRRAFFEAAHQSASVNPLRVLYSPSASISIDIVANYLRMRRLSVALIEPTFDNLADILKRHGVPLDALREDHLRSFGIEDWLDGVKADAIFVVMPNNPTGYCLTAQDFGYLVDYCVREQKLLLLDFSFRFFSSEMLSWDQYALLEQSGVHYIAIEDTGKTWPTLELKVGPLVADRLTYPGIRSIYRDFFMCHSPVILALLSKVIETSRELGLEVSVLAVPRKNREALQRTIANAPLKPMSAPGMSVEWIHLEIPLTDLEVVDRLKKHGIYILPGRNFFWKAPALGSHFIRVALMRDTALFAEGMKRLHTILPEVLDCG